MANQFDITKHKWRDGDRGRMSNTIMALPTNNGNLILDIDDDQPSYHNNQITIHIYKDDAIAIAKHFYEKLSTHERLEYINSIRGVSNA